MENTRYTIKPAAGLLILSLTIGLASWLLNLCALLLISLPALGLSVWVLFSILFSNSSSRLRWWLLPVIMGVLISSFYAAHFFITRFDDRLQGKDLDIQGYIASLPVVNGAVTRFDFDIDRPLPEQKEPGQKESGQNESGQSPKKVRLNWYEAPVVKVGERWRMTVRLRQPHSFASPGAFDYEVWLLRQPIQATGYVRSGALLSGSVLSKYPVHQIRAELREWLVNTVSPESVGVLAALLLGDKSAVTAQQWRLFNETGTTHLMVISGLHIGLMAWLGFSFAALMGKAGALPLRRLPLPVIKAFVGMLFALCYALLAGFSIPVQRTLVMTLAALLAPLFGIRASPLTLWLLALAAVLTIDPLAVTSQGFWYSFIAVAALLFGMAGRQSVQDWRVKAFKPQWLVFLILTPLLLVNGQPVSPFSPLVNLIAIPFIGIGVVPLLLFSALLQFLLPDVASFILFGVDALVTGFQWSLQWVFDFMVLIPPRQSAHWPPIILAMAGMLLLISPGALRLRWLSPVLLLPLLFPGQYLPPTGQAEVTVLDVGQGLSILIKTHRHLLVYDTGDRFSEHLSAAESVIFPALALSGVTRIDRIMISHGDKDHSGGLLPLLSRYDGVPVVSGTELPHYNGKLTRCKAGDHWQWDGVDFQVISGGVYRRSNDASCVLKITAGSESILLPGDISGRIERHLLDQGADLKANVLVAAHHGSRFSSSPEFLASVQPEAVIFSSGFANRFGHPTAETVKRFQKIGARIYNTASDGSLSLILGSGEPAISAYRKKHARYWWR
ncbi:DNA internalization-related competence protein ComEC/Rec2 [Endozoicomonas sp.]|uniref:DNA internalization-related competence protein ComEC/Rec2 n=1 Tax=Endozoicomonas sp. TaxID=1892382 RepID=UPI00383A825B